MSQAILETMESGTEVRTLFVINSPEAAEQKAIVEEVFGPQNWAGYISIGNPVFNPVLGTRVVTAVCGVIPQYLYNIGARAAERKFHLDTGCMYDKMYTFAPTLDQLPSLPTSAKPIAIGYNHTIAGRNGDKSVEDALDVYFSADPDETELFFGLDKKRGLVATFYGVTYQRDTKEVLRVKVYTYDHEDGHHDWEQALEAALLTNTEQNLKNTTR